MCKISDFGRKKANQELRQNSFGFFQQTFTAKATSQEFLDGNTRSDSMAQRRTCSYHDVSWVISAEWSSSFLRVFVAKTETNLPT